MLKLKRTDIIMNDEVSQRVNEKREKVKVKQSHYRP
jgi:hypothetical protein